MPREISDKHCKFTVSWSLYPLLSTNYLVRKLIFRCLEKSMLSESMCKTCRPHAAFQTAFCHYVGFGTNRDKERAIQIARHPGVRKRCDPLEVLEDEACEISPYWVYTNLSFTALNRRGFTFMANIIAEYRAADNYDVEEVIKEYEREAGDMAASFPDFPEICLVPKMTLAQLLRDTGSPEKAVPLYREILASLRPTVPRKKDEKGSDQERLVMVGLAEALRSLGRLREAEEVAADALRSVGRPRETKRSTEKRPRKAKRIPVKAVPMAPVRNEIFLMVKAMLACIYHAREEWERAAAEFQEVVGECGELLGSRHPNTLRAMHGRAVALAEIPGGGRLAEAEDLARETVRLCNEVLDDKENGKAHELSITATTTLATLMAQPEGGRSREALELMKEAVRNGTRALGPRDPITLASEARLAGMYAHVGRAEEAEELYRTVLEKQQAVLGPAHPTTLDTLDGLLNLLPEEKRRGVLGAALEGVDMGELGKDLDHPAFVRFQQMWLPKV